MMMNKMKMFLSTLMRKTMIKKRSFYMKNEGELCENHNIYSKLELIEVSVELQYSYI